jgi:hypothetical protein
VVLKNGSLIVHTNTQKVKDMRMNDLHARKQMREFMFRVLLYTALLIFVFDFNIYRYGVDVRLGRFMHNLVANFERDATNGYHKWEANL